MSYNLTILSHLWNEENAYNFYKNTTGNISNCHCNMKRVFHYLTRYLQYDLNYLVVTEGADVELIVY